MENRHLLDVEKFKELARPTSKHIDDDEIQAFIDECEQMFIIPAIGYANFKAACDSKNEALFDNTFDDTFSGTIWLDGGEWKRKSDECGCRKGDETTMYCVGLRKTLSYFVYAKMLRADGSILARSGFMKHDDSYASHIVDKANGVQYNDVMDIAEKYLNDCMLYANYHTKENKVKPIRGTRARIKAIGD